MLKNTDEKARKRVAFHNLGCKVNSYETEILLQKFREKGYEIVTFEQKAEVYVVNTCTVTQIADKKSRQMLRRARKINPEAVVVAAGCYVETGAEALVEEGTVDLAVGNTEKGQIAELVERLLRERADGLSREPRLFLHADADSGEPSACSVYTTGECLTGISRTRAFIKIQDGCDQFCSYCVIPYARGRAKSRETAEIVAEVAGLAARGVQEVVLTGIHVSSFGQRERGRFDGEKLIDLIGQLSETPGLERIRLGSLEPRLITQETARAFAELSDRSKGGRLCPHFHLSLQSGCNETLFRMNRHYTSAQYAASVACLRESIDRPAVTTDVIVGFPGETEEEFAETCRFLEDLSLYEIHVFPYSRRTGTVAAGMPGQVLRAEKERRGGVLLRMTASQARDYRASFLGETLRVLWEEEEEIDGRRCLTGHTERYLKAAVPVEEAGQRGDVCGMISEIAARTLSADGTVLLP
ncbi:MAG: tRNA (N(6)-L-threonylcarbamoyladenosine(37)-C(2))-methylthiotransferase MtaB [Lachnospiraceae bacterium]|nr:tRNA (N(6)-L-threonylcarbamoyladenosine(37)-C(2))-methylthiotransferase MtaB [Lachnospiraceae bacterium]